jgi:PD-(D/E)XK nuclease superfamily
MTKISLRQSDLGTFDECRRKYYLQNVLQIGDRVYGERVGPRKIKTADVGTMVHGCLKLLYTEELTADVIAASAPNICALVAKEIGGCDEEIDGWPVWGEGWISGIETASIMVRGYISWVSVGGHDLRYSALAVEERIVWDNGLIVITGQPDLVMLDEITEEVGILDTKTVDKLASPRPGNFQLLTYGLIWWRTRGTIPQWAGHNQLVRNKQTKKATPPFYARQPVTLGEEILLQHEEVVMQLSREIVDFHERVSLLNHHLIARPNMTGECSWKCPVEFLCDHMHDGSDWPSMAETHYQIRTNREGN